MDRRMFDFEELYVIMADLLPDECRVAEVGVADGASSIFLLEHLLNEGKDPTFWMIDSLAYGGYNQLNEILRHIGEARLSAHIQILTQGSLEASCRFPDHYFDFIFIDASHKYEETKADIRLWWQKVKDDGCLAGHDFADNEEVKRAVTEVIPAEFLRTFETSAGHGVWMIDKNPHTRIL
jgi:predicted O-methyltransferase YrrM